jgi:tetratricopeptide (TPR) repeat protein
VPCLRCSCETEEGALVCDKCAGECYGDPEFFLNPTLVGTSVLSRLRGQGSAAYLLGPTSSSPIMLLPSSDLAAYVRDIPVQGVRKEDLKPIYGKVNALLSHLGVPLRTDRPELLLTPDAADVITSAARKMNALERMYPMEGISDLYIRMGVIYWCASKSILLRTASEKWREEKTRYLLTRAKEYLSKVGPQDELYSIASRTLGAVCLDSRDWAEAEDHLSEALRRFPNDITIMEWLARAHLSMGNSTDALALVDDALVQGENPRIWVLKGRVLHSMDRLEDSVECFSSALKCDSRCLEAHDMLIHALNELGRLEEAAQAMNERTAAKRPWLEEKVREMVSELKTAAEETPVEAPAPARKGKRQRKVRAAAPPTPPEDPLEAAKKALAEKDYDLAVQRAKHLLKQKPDLKEAQQVMMTALVEKGSLKEAAPLVHSYYEKNQDDPAAWHLRGRLADKEGRWGAAVQYFSKAVTIDRNAVESWLEMGDVLLAHDKVSGADESYSRVIQLDSENARAWLGKAKAMHRLGRWGAAIQCLDRYTPLAPEDEEVWLLKAEILHDKGKLERALESYDKYLSMRPDDPKALGKKGVVLNALGRPDEARVVLEESLRLDPKNKDAERWLRTIPGGEG